MVSLKNYSKSSQIWNVSALLVSYQSLVLKGISGYLNENASINLLQHASNKLEMILRIHEHNPSVVIINNDRDYTDNSDSIETIRLALREFPSIKILFIIDKNDRDLELRVLKIGVRGVITKNFEQQTLFESINTVSNGGLWFRKEVMEQFITEQLLFNRYSDNNTPSLPSFTRRELEIIQLVVHGQKNREIGNKLFISEKTVKHHLTKIFRKLNINKRIQLKGLI